MTLKSPQIVHLWLLVCWGPAQGFGILPWNEPNDQEVKKHVTIVWKTAFNHLFEESIKRSQRLTNFFLQS